MYTVHVYSKQLKLNFITVEVNEFIQYILSLELYGKVFTTETRSKIAFSHVTKRQSAGQQAENLFHETDVTEVEFIVFGFCVIVVVRDE